MSFSNLTFVFIFLPVSLILYRFIPEKGRNVLLFILGLVFYAWGSPKNLLLLLVSVLFNYASARVISENLALKRKNTAKTAALIGVIANIGVLAVFKYTTASLPVGISFYTFSALSYILDVYWNRADNDMNLLETGLYITFFAKVTSGPIVQFKDMKEQIRKRQYSSASVASGLNLFLMGLFKKLLIADNLGVAFSSIYAVSNMSSASAWLGMIYYSLQLYFDFSGYSDMAIGLAKMFGFDFDRNFNYPYLAEGITDFWRRWHISLGAWFRDYIYIPLGGNRCGTGMQLRNLAIVWILTGAWHGNTLNFIFWGIWHGVFVILDKFFLGDVMKRLPRAVRIILTDLEAFIGWIFFFTPTIGSSFSYIGKLFKWGGGNAFWNADTTFSLKGNLILLVVSFLLCGPLVKNMHDKLVFRSGDTRRKYISVGIYCVLLAFCVAAMVSQTYSTFLYFQF